MRILINEREQEALMQCCHEAVRLYVLLLRPKMDVRTCTVGDSFPISRGRLALDMSWSPPRGSHKPAYSPTIKQVRGLLDELIGYGLLISKSKSEPGDNQLIFSLPLADRAEVRSCEEGPMKGRQEGPMKGRYEGPVQTKQTQGFAANEGPAFVRNEGPMNGRQEGPMSEFRGKFLETVVVDQSEVCAAENVTTLPVREVELSKLLRANGIEATPVIMRRSDFAEAIKQDDSDWIAAAATARARKPGQKINPAYLLPMLAEMRMSRMQNGHQASGPQVGLGWLASWQSIVAKGVELGLPSWKEGDREPFPYYRARVLEAAGVTEEQLRTYEIDRGVRKQR